MPRIAILGAGISGLAAALHITDRCEQTGNRCEVIVLERENRAGGCVQTIERHGTILELGADSLLVEKPAAADLIARLGLSGEIIDMRAQYKGALIVHRGELRRIPSQFRLFTPTSIPALLRSGIFSPLGIARAAVEPLIPRRPHDVDDESVASFVTRRLGREAFERLAQPIIGGIYSGDAFRLGMRATMPQFLDMEERYGSLLRAMRAARTAGVAPRLASLRGGVGTIVSAMCLRLGDKIRTGCTVRALDRADGTWTISLASGERLPADAIVSALPAYETAALLQHEDAQLANVLQAIRYNSIATINLVYTAEAAGRIPPGTGFVVPAVEQRKITAATFTTQKYEGRADDATVLVRAFVGGALQAELVRLGDRPLIEVAQNELRELRAVQGSPYDAVVTRWLRLLPEYEVGHHRRVREAFARAAALSGFSLAGSAYNGVGIPDCIQTGQTAGESAFGYIIA